MNHCTECFARLDGCQECMDAELAVKDKEIEGLKSGITQIIWEVKAGATDVEMLAICRKMLGIEGEK